MKLFLVDGHAPTLHAMARALHGLGTLRCVAPEDVERQLADGAGRVVCLGPHVDAALAERIAKAAPDSHRLAWIEAVDVGQLQAFLGAGGVAGVFPWPMADQGLRFAVGSALETVARVTRRAAALAGFHKGLHSGDSLATMAASTADALHLALDGAAVLVQLWDQAGLEADGVRPSGDRGRHWFEAARGGEMSSELHTRSLFDGDRSIGEIVVDQGQGLAAGRETRALVEPFAAYVGLVAGAQIRQRESDRAVHRLMAAVAGLAGCREHVGNRHVERIGGFVRLLAVGLREDGHFVDQLSDDGIDDFVRAVALHDIGKLSVPDAILLKPAQLSSVERRVVETHASSGGDALTEALTGGGGPQFLELARDAARDHHEKWDGSGYPRGMAGDHIPLVARILALADIYDALTSRRPYRDAWSHARAVQYISELSGTHLDPRIVESFMVRASAAEALRDRLRDEEPEYALAWPAA